MVSFQCEGCGDVIKKPKLDSHRNQCRGATFSCLDCSTHFRGIEYRSHTSCITEDQKYQGHLYREKPSKPAKRKSVSIVEPNQNALVHAPHHAYVEDAPDADTGAPPPHVPSPPPAVSTGPATDVNVFDFMVNETTPKASQEIVSKKKSYRNSEEQLNNIQYEENGFSYGTEPVIPRPLADINGSLISLEFMTPAAKETRAKLDRKDRTVSATHSRTNSGNMSDKKRKRGHVEDPYAQAGTYELEGDTLMPDAPQTAGRSTELTHSGLTGGLTRLMSQESDGSPDGGKGRDRESRRTIQRAQQQQDDPASPLKRSRRSKESEDSRDRNGEGNGLGISIKGRASRASKVLSMVGGVGVLAALANPAAAQNQGTSQALVKKGRRPSDESYERERGGSVVRGERKKHKVHRHNGTARENVRYESGRRGSQRRDRDDRSRSPEASSRKLKAIEYQKRDDSDSDSDDERGGESQMVVFGAHEKHQTRCETFLRFVTKGPESEKGCSINKALKRWHRNAEVRKSDEKLEEEKELWRTLRLRRNERGEVVVFF